MNYMIGLGHRIFLPLYPINQSSISTPTFKLYLCQQLFEIGKQIRQLQQPQAHPIYFVHMTAGKHNEIYKANGDAFSKVVTSFTDACISFDFGWHKDLTGLEIVSSNS